MNNVKIDPSICPKCLGSGKVDGKVCDKCWGRNTSIKNKENGKKISSYRNN